MLFIYHLNDNAKKKHERRMQMSNNIRKHLMIENILQTKNIGLINIFISNYGELALLELDQLGLHILLEILASDQSKLSLINKITSVMELRRVFDGIVDKFGFANDDFKLSIINLIKNMKRTGIDSQKTHEAKLQFIAKILMTEINLARDNDQFNNYTSDIINAIVENKYLNLDEVQDIVSILAESNYDAQIRDIYIGLIENLERTFSHTNRIEIALVMLEFSKITNSLDYIIRKYELMINKERLIREGLNLFLETTWFFNNAVGILVSIINTPALEINVNLDMYKIFFEEFTRSIIIPEKEAAEEMIAYRKETDGFFPYEYVLNKLDDLDMDSIIYSIFFKEDIDSFPMSFFYKSEMDRAETIAKSVDVLISHNVLPGDWVENPGRFITEIEMNENIIEGNLENNNSFNIDAILSEIEGITLE